MAVKTRPQLKAECEDGTTLFQDQLFDIIDSCFNIADDNQIGLTDYAPATVYAIGQTCVFLNAIFRKRSGAGAGTDPTNSSDWEKIGGDFVEVLVVSAADPRPQLNAQSGVTGGYILVRQDVPSGSDIVTLYQFDVDTLAEDQPYAVLAATSGTWLAVAGAYHQGAQRVNGGIDVLGSGTIRANFHVVGTAQFTGTVIMDAGLQVAGNVSMASDASVAGNVSVDGDTTLNGQVNMRQPAVTNDGIQIITSTAPDADTPLDADSSFFGLFKALTGSNKYQVTEPVGWNPTLEIANHSGVTVTLEALEAVVFTGPTFTSTGTATRTIANGKAVRLQFVEVSPGIKYWFDFDYA